MQEVLNSLFGPATGLIGMALLVIMLLPKFVVRWRGRNARKRTPVQERLKPKGLRALEMEPWASCKDIAAHETHGETFAALKGLVFRPLIELIVCVAPLVLVILFVPAGQFSLRVILFVVTIPLALMGLLSLKHLGDSVVFYKTGFCGRIGMKRVDHDYNEIIEVTERKAMIPGLASSYILHLDDGHVMDVNGGYFADGRRLKRIFGSLGTRVVVNASEEKMRAG
ncbi:MAG: hypothetical protein II180_09000 [Proteobacteria bacterium]|nr:hypothetical protein [Pseudomonadota bacterium]